MFDFDRVLEAFMKLALLRGWDYPVRRLNHGDNSETEADPDTQGLSEMPEGRPIP